MRVSEFSAYMRGRGHDISPTQLRQWDKAGIVEARKDSSGQRRYADTDARQAEEALALLRMGTPKQVVAQMMPVLRIAWAYRDLDLGEGYYPRHRGKKGLEGKANSARRLLKFFADHPPENMARALEPFLGIASGSGTEIAGTMRSLWAKLEHLSEFCHHAATIGQVAHLGFLQDKKEPAGHTRLAERLNQMLPFLIQEWDEVCVKGGRFGTVPIGKGSLRDPLERDAKHIETLLKGSEEFRKVPSSSTSRKRKKQAVARTSKGKQQAPRRYARREGTRAVDSSETTPEPSRKSND